MIRAAVNALMTTLNPGRRTEEGYAIYKEDELGINNEGGGQLAQLSFALTNGRLADTPLCPFDCNCCKVFLDVNLSTFDMSAIDNRFLIKLGDFEHTLLQTADLNASILWLSSFVFRYISFRRAEVH
jgi:hypothetical protein